MKNKIYVGNLPYSINEDSLMRHFEKFGKVASSRVIVDRDTNRSKGFGFIEMGSENEATDAISSLDGQELEGRTLKVNLAKPREERSGGGNFRF